MIQLFVNTFVKKDNQLENLSHIATIVGVLLAIIVAIGGVIKYFSEKKDKKYERYMEEKRNKGDKLTETYKELLKIIALFPNKTPYDVMNKLSELDEIEEDIDYREGHATAGYVYVISNIGSFGENVYKIGVTRRLEPLERIRELSSASVPFQFDIHALIFSEEAFALETELHNQLSQYKVNKVNGRKEYFKVPFAIIKDILDTHKELTVELTENAEAFEYRQTKAIEEQQ